MHARPPVPRTPPRRPVARHKRRRLYSISAIVLTIAAVISLLVFVLLSWHPANHPGPVIHTTPHPSRPTATPQPTPTATAVPTSTPTPISASQQLTSQLDSLFSNLLTQQQFSGSVLIMRSGQTLLNKGYGMADWSQNIPNDTNTRFFLGSVTKEFTATAILILQERGKLHVQDSLCVYINPCPALWQTVTIHEVLTHTSGIPQDSDIPLENALSPSAWIYTFNDYPLEYTPGSEYDYCSVCYQVLGYVVQQASGQTYAQFLQQNIFDPLQMRATSFSSSAYYANVHHATGYASWQAPAENDGWDDIGMTSSWSFLFSSGVLTTTTGDLYLWDQGLNTHKILSQQSLDQAYTAFSPVSLFAGSGYGYGWFIGKSPVAGHRLIWHDGVIDGFRTYIGRYIDDSVTVIFLSNLDNTDTLSIAHSIEQLVFHT